MVLMPNVIEESGRGLKSFNLVDKLFDENIIILEGDITDDLAAVIKMQLFSKLLYFRISLFKYGSKASMNIKI